MTPRSESNPPPGGREGGGREQHEDSKTRIIPGHELERTRTPAPPPTPPTSREPPTVSLEPKEPLEQEERTPLKAQPQERIEERLARTLLEEETPAPFSLAPDPVDTSVGRDDTVFLESWIKRWGWALVGLAVGTLIVVAGFLLSRSPQVNSVAPITLSVGAVASELLDAPAAPGGFVFIASPESARAVAESLLHPSASDKSSLLSAANQDVLREAFAAEALDMNGDGVRDVLCLTREGRALFIDGKSGAIEAKGSRGAPVSGKSVRWELTPEKLSLTFADRRGDATRVTCDLAGESRKQGELLVQLWRKARSPNRESTKESASR